MILIISNVNQKYKYNNIIRNILISYSNELDIMEFVSPLIAG